MPWGRTICPSLLFLTMTVPLWPAMVVTHEGRFTGSISSETEQNVNLTFPDGTNRSFARQKILQIFNDQGELVWQANELPEEKRPEPENKPEERSFAKRTILFDFYMGGVMGGLYADENRFVADAGIAATYSDGSAQYAVSSMFVLGGGASYQRFESDRWSMLVSYLFQTTSQSVTIGDGARYEKNLLSSLTVTQMHHLFYGKEAHFYPANENSSFDIIGQIGYCLGSYFPLTTHNDYRENVTPLPAAYTGSQTVLVHGLTGRIGGGITFRGERWQIRFLGFYQLTSAFLAEKTILSDSVSSLVHNVYGGISLGYGW